MTDSESGVLPLHYEAFQGFAALHQYKLAFGRLTSALSRSGCVDQISDGHVTLQLLLRLLLLLLILLLRLLLL